MDKIFIRERINIVDYENNNMGLIYSSADIDMSNTIVNVSLQGDVSGWYELKFDVPGLIMVEGKPVPNPLLLDIFPMSKIKYTRVIKEGDDLEELVLYFIVQPQENRRDESGITLHSFSCIDYPRHTLSKAKNGLTIGEDTIDNNRSRTPNNELINVDGKVIYVEAPVQSREFNTYEEMGLWADALPGAFAYVKGTNKGYRLTGKENTLKDTNGKLVNWYELAPNQTYKIEGGSPIPEPVWNPDWEGYPWMENPNNYNYGTIGIPDIDPSLVQFYWNISWFNPDRTIGRYDGLLYQEGSRLIYNIFETVVYKEPDDFIGTYYKSSNLNEISNAYKIGTTAYVLATNTVWRYNGTSWEDTHQNKREAFKAENALKGDWSKLDPINAYLTPNFAQPYLEYILEGTGWTVGEVDKIMVSDGTVQYDEEGRVHPKEVELSTTVTFDNSNAYNGIYEISEAFKCYPRFDHVNKTVSLKAVPGEDNGLTYTYSNNLSTSRIHQDGEKTVSKLWVYGGEDLYGQVYIQDCNRMHPDYYLADYTSLKDLEDRVKAPKDNNYAKVSTSYTWNELISQTLAGGKRLPIANTFLAGELPVTSWGGGSIPEINSLSQLPSSGSLGQTVFIVEENSYWSWLPEGKGWYDTFLELEPTDGTYSVKFEQRYDYEADSWVDKGQFYHWYEPVSPYADNYIMDFRYFVSNGLMTESQVEDIKFNYVLPISRLNKKRWPIYKQYQTLSSELQTLNSTYDECKIARDAIDTSIKTNYAIYETKNGITSLKELDIKAYPPGANLNTTGWVLAEIAYSDADVPVVATYGDISKIFPNPQLGNYVKVTDETAVYYWSSTYSFADTICAYLGWTENQIKNTQEFADQRKKELLFSPDGTIEARVRNEGLFQKLRDEELFSLRTEELGELGKDGRQYWRNPMANIHGMPMTNLSENSTAFSYYNSQNRFITEQINMNEALDQIGRVETDLTLLVQKIEVLEGRITNMNNALYEQYGDYIVEGSFTDSTMVWIYNLWYAGLEALELYYRPLVTYEFGVVDVSGLPEYRTATPEVYHDIVYLMNKPELVLPNPGDYCYVTDKKLGIVREKANITSITRNLSNPSMNKIAIATVDTNTEDLIGKLVTAANTIYSKEHIYNRSAVIKSDGTIAQDSMTETLDDNSGKLTLLSNNGTVKFGDSGITTVDRNNAQLRMQYTGKGIFASTNGGTTWDNIVNAGKISIKSLSAGTIDSNSISITNIGHDSSVIIDGKGITALNYDSTTSAPDISNWKIDKNKCSFFLDALSGNAYFKGYLEAGAGLIGGWDISPSKLYKGGTGMSSTGTYAFWAGDSNPGNAEFSVRHDGTVKATNATIQGNITANSLVLGSGVNIGEGNLNLPSYIKKDIEITGAGGKKFKVSSNGYLEAVNAHITGTIFATSGEFTGTVNANGGTIGGFTLTDSKLYSGSGSTMAGMGVYGKEYAFWAGSGQSYSAPFRVGHDGSLYATSARISGTITASSFRGGYFSGNITSHGTISGGTISGANINIGKANGSGSIKFKSEKGFLTLGDVSNHPWASALNVSDRYGGIVFYSGDTSESTGTQHCSISGGSQGVTFNLTGKKLKLRTSEDTYWEGQDAYYSIKLSSGKVLNLKFQSGLLVASEVV